MTVTQEKVSKEKEEPGRVGLEEGNLVNILLTIHQFWSVYEVTFLVMQLTGALKGYSGAFYSLCRSLTIRRRAQFEFQLYFDGKIDSRLGAAAAFIKKPIRCNYEVPSGYEIAKAKAV